MDIGDYADVQALASQVDDGVLRDVLAHAQAGQFNERMNRILGMLDLKLSVACLGWNVAQKSARR